VSEIVEPVSAPAARVLVVDDDPDLVDVIRQVLEDEGLRIETARDGRRAIAAIERQAPDLVVLDMTLPVLDGVRVGAWLSESGDGAIPILVITADGSAAEKAAKVGAFAYLRKPFTLNDLVETVWQGLGKASASS
jgi:CheY-like chemotaxis protein